MPTLLEKRIQALEAMHEESVDEHSTDFSIYRYDPVRYAREIHKLEVTPQQVSILEGLIEPPFRVFARSANTQGKSFIAALAVNWWYDTRNPSIAITTAPTQAQVEEILWGEIRGMRTKAGLGGFKSAVAPRLYDSPNHWARGYTANTGTSFHGRHNECVLIVVDEAIGVGPEFFPAAESMLNGKEYAFLLLYNPTDGTSHIRRMEENGKNKVVQLSALEHPNVIAEMRNEPAPFPAAVHLQWVEDFIVQYGDPILEGSHDPLRDVEIGKRLVNGEWTKGKWYRPTGEVEARVLGRWPTHSEMAVWSEYAWQMACSSRLVPSGRLQVGVDVALDGPDKSAFAVRRGGVLLHVETHQGWKPEQTHNRAKELAWEFAKRGNENPREVPIVVDDIGCGSKVMACHSDGYNFIGYTVSEVANDDYHYPNKRSEIAFRLSEHARDGGIYFGDPYLPKATVDELKNQFLSMRYRFSPQCIKRIVLPKPEQKKLLGKSPDEADAVMLAYASVGASGRSSERVVGCVR